jgi:hypothetical protein
MLRNHEVLLGRRLAALLWLWSLAWGLSPAHAAVQQQCVAGGTIAAPLDFASPDTWSPPGVPTADSDLVLSAACAVRCNAGECDAHTLKGTNPAGSFEIAPGASLVLAGCDTASAYTQATYQCGAEAGFRFAPQGAVVHDSSLDGNPIVRGASLPAQPGHLRLVLAYAIDAAVGDWFQVRGGPERSQVHRVAGVDVTGCPGDPTHCFLELELHDPAMEFGQNAQTAGYATGIGYFAPGTMRVASLNQPGYAANDYAHCVELCTTRDVDGNCIDSTAITRNESYAGWYLGASDAALDPASPTAMGGRRMLIVDSRHGVPETIGGNGQVDRVCFADPIPNQWIPYNGWSDRSAVVWTGFWPGDAWVLFRPATVRYAGAEGDGGLGFHGACVDSDFAYFDNWAKIATRDGTPACQRPYQDTVITSWAHGIAGVPMDQQSACNGHSLDIIGYTALSGDRVALADTRTKVDLSYICYPGVDPAIDSGYHGLALANTYFDPTSPPAEWLVRYAGDDGIYIGSGGLGPLTYRLPRWTWWWNQTGVSTEVVDFLSSDPGQTVRFEDARVVMYPSSPGCKGAIDDPNGNATFQIDGMLYVDPGHPGPLIGLGNDAGHDVHDVLAYGDVTAACPAMRSGKVRNSWLVGWNRLIDYRLYQLEGVYFSSRGGAASGAVLGYLPPGQAVTAHDFVLEHLPASSVIQSGGCGAGCDLTLRDGFASWTAPFLNGVSNFYNTSTVHLVAPIEGLLFANSSLLTCSAGWGESGAHIGRNLLYQAPGGVAINNLATCPLAAPQRLDTTTGLAPSLPYRADLAGERFGPQGRVGLESGTTIAIDADLRAPFAIPAEQCADGIDDDWDGRIDLQDPGCSDATDPSEHASNLPCDDGIDNDGDGKVDAGFDPGCPGPKSLLENPACDDGIDNDGDGLIDFADPQCSKANPSSESPHGCGLGGELGALALVFRRFARVTRTT